MLINIIFSDGKQDQIGNETLVCMSDIPDDVSQLAIHSGNLALKTTINYRWTPDGIVRYNRVPNKV